MIQCNLGRVMRSYIYTDENAAWSVVNTLKVIILPSYLTMLFLNSSNQIKFPSPPFFGCLKHKAQTRRHLDRQRVGLSVFVTM